jgi:hypothetical protein
MIKTLLIWAPQWRADGKLNGKLNGKPVDFRLPNAPNGRAGIGVMGNTPSFGHLGFDT